MTTDLSNKTVKQLRRMAPGHDDLLHDCVTGEAADELARRLEEAQQRITALEKSHELAEKAHENRIMKHIETAKELEAAQPAARWISCDEKMPDLTGRDDSHVPGGAPATLYSERVLVFDGTVRIDNLIQAEGSPETRTFYVGSRKPVTHWMQLPEPPEAIREEQEGK